MTSYGERGGGERERGREEGGGGTHLGVEVEESMWAVDIVERSKRHHWPIDEHGVKGQSSPLGHHQPVGMATTHKHLINEDISRKKIL